MKNKSKDKKKHTSGGKKGTGFGRKVLWSFVFMLLLGALFSGYELYKTIFAPNVFLKYEKSSFLYIPSNAKYEDVIQILKEKHFLANIESFDWLASGLDYKSNVHPGKYKIRSGMSNKDLLVLLKSGRQTAVKLVLNNLRTKEELVSRISKQVEADSSVFLGLLNSVEYMAKYNLDTQNALSLVMPNTYEVYWNTSPIKILDKIGSAYKKFWGSERLKKSKKLNFTPAQVIVLASIVEKETLKNSEKMNIAGVYINRLRLGHKLEADPTLVYACGDFAIRRVLNVHREIDSPYNTYMYPGLPPGPICMPSVSSIDAVLNYEKHDYLYFCAKPDFSGFHQFSRTFEEHLSVARQFRKELGRRNIMN